MTGASPADPAPAALQLKVFTSPTRVIGGGGNRTFSPITSTLIYGAADAVLVDAQFIEEDVRALGDMIEQSGRKLVTIFITHGHGDHYFGAGNLVQRFPGTTVVAVPSVVSYIKANLDQDLKTWSAMFGDAIAVPTVIPSPTESDTINLEGRALRIIEVGQADIAPTAVLHVEPLNAVIAGDVAYNQIHQMLGFGGPAEWAKWIDSIDAIARLHPQIVVAGHKKPDAADDEPDRILNDSRAYIQDFAEAAGSASSVEELVGTMRAKYPDHGNLTTLLYSANAAIGGRSRS